MSHWPKLIPLLLSAALGGAPGTVLRAQEVQDSSVTFPVRGVVLNSATRAPVARALVNANGDDALTDSEGRFELHLRAGFSQLNVRRPGYDSARRSGAYAVRVGENTPELTLYLTPQATIVGHVTLSTADEADGIWVTAWRLTSSGGHDAWNASQSSATTNSEGVFRLGNLDAPASYLLCSSSSLDRTGAPARGGIGWGYPSVCYPSLVSSQASGAGEAAPANLIALTPGQTIDAWMTLTREPFYPVSISVPNLPQGQAVSVQIHDQSGRIVDASARWTPQKALAQANLPAGQYYAVLRSRGQPGSYARVDFRVGAGPVAGISAMLLPMRPIAVHVRRDFTVDRESERQGGVALGDAQQANPSLTLNLLPGEPFAGGTAGRGLAPAEGSSDNTSFEMGGVEPGRYWAQTFAFRGYVASIASGGVDLSREPLIVGPGSTSAPIEIVLRDDSGQIAGTVRSATSGAAGAGGEEAGVVNVVYVTAVPLFPSSTRAAQAGAQEGGTFTVGNLKPGSYRVFATDEAFDAGDLQCLARYAGKGQTVTVEANGTANVQLDLIPALADGANP